MKLSLNLLESNKMEEIIKYEAPKKIWDVYDNININNILEFNDPRYVPTDKVRGNFSFSNFYRKLKVDIINKKFHDNNPSIKNYSVFCGHRGCGKTTELRRLASELDKEDLFLVIFIETAKELDSNDIHFTDICMAIVKRLLERLDEFNITIDKQHLNNLESWFYNKIMTKESKIEAISEISAGVELKTEIPFLAKLFTKITSTFKTSASNKVELRKNIQSEFTDFAFAFNNLLDAVRDKLPSINRFGLLFIVDDIEKLSLEDARKILIENVNKLKLLNSNFIYTAPIHLTYFDSQIQNHYYSQMFPMIKTFDKDGNKNYEGFKAMREMILRRADISLFESDEVIEKVIEFSGGNSSYLFRILELAYLNAKADIFDMDSVNSAIKIIATEFRRFLKTEHYELLFKIDTNDIYEISDESRFLLFHLALLEYNEYWWKSHPAVRTLEEYKKYSPKKKTTTKKTKLLN